MSPYYPYAVIAGIAIIIIMYRLMAGNPEKEEIERITRNHDARKQTHIDYIFNLKPILANDGNQMGDMMADNPDYFLYHIQYADGSEGVTDNPNAYPLVSTMGVGHRMQAYTASSNQTAGLVEYWLETQRNREKYQNIPKEELTKTAIRDLWNWSAQHPETWAENNPQDYWD
jgi:hypothetical protein